MLRLSRPSKNEKAEFLAASRNAETNSPSLLTLEHGSLGNPPKGFAHDLSESEIGRGLGAFAAAREAFQVWEQFDLGWVQVVNPMACITPGELVGVEAHTACFWSINLSRIVEVVDCPTRFGFMYTTTAIHVEEGQERFIIDFDPKSESVSYVIEAISRPRHILARVAYPFSRAMQHRFARDSHARIKRSIEEHTSRDV